MYKSLESGSQKTEVLDRNHWWSITEAANTGGRLEYWSRKMRKEYKLFSSNYM
jgi:hypothetical protein